MNTKKLLTALLIVALIVVYYLLGTDYLKQLRQHDSLPAQIAKVTRNWAQIPARPADLEQRLSTAQAELETVENTLPGELNSTRIVNTILIFADEIGVKAIPLVTQSWSNEGTDNYTYAVFRLNVAVTGTFTELVAFLNELENGELQTLVLEYAGVNRADESSENASIPENTVPINASLDIAVYSQPRTYEETGKVY